MVELTAAENAFDEAACRKKLEWIGYGLEPDLSKAEVHSREEEVKRKDREAQDEAAAAAMDAEEDSDWVD